MPQFFFFVLLAIFLGFVADHWQVLAIGIGGIACLFGLIMVGSWLLIQRDQKRQDEEAELEREKLRVEPLAEDESIIARIENRFRQTCEDQFDRLANMHVRGIDDWRLDLRTLISDRLIPVLNAEQRAKARDMQRLRDDNPFERPIISLSAFKNRQAKEFAKKMAADVRNRYHVSAMTPVEFEIWCRDMLSQQGWQARILGGSGDQGADVIATRGGATLVLQCKYYASPVGNAAVQEVYAAKSFYRASHAAVVTNSNYTRGGVLLAERTGVLLLSARELMQIDGVIRII